VKPCDILVFSCKHEDRSERPPPQTRTSHLQINSHPHYGIILRCPQPTPMQLPHSSHLPELHHSPRLMVQVCHNHSCRLHIINTPHHPDFLFQPVHTLIIHLPQTTVLETPIHHTIICHLRVLIQYHTTICTYSTKGPMAHTLTYLSNTFYRFLFNRY
jgi:hypothetical protein